MNAKIHYGGTAFHVAGGEERAAEILKEIRATITAGGGIMTVDTATGRASFVLGAGIPFAIELVPEAGVLV